MMPPARVVAARDQYDQRRFLGANFRFDQRASRDVASAPHRRTAALRRIEKS
jgi:hypothetical protein